jgi:predicted transglutaminase-like cysteine proteinase
VTIGPLSWGAGRVRSIKGIVVVAALLAAVCRPIAAEAAQPFLNYSELSLPSGENFPKWKRIGTGLAEEIAAVEACLDGAGCPAGLAGEIAGRLAGMNDAPPLSQAKAVHTLMNSRPYLEDRRQFGRSDVWQMPFEFWRSGGDCEDYAIAKYMALRALGFSDAQLRLTVMTGRASREVHAVLLIEIGKDWYVADNLKRDLRPLTSYDGWTPEFSVSAAGAWRYIANLTAGPSVASTDILPEPAAALQSAVVADARSRL